MNSIQIGALLFFTGLVSAIIVVILIHYFLVGIRRLEQRFKIIEAILRIPKIIDLWVVFLSILGAAVIIIGLTVIGFLILRAMGVL